MAVGRIILTCIRGAPLSSRCIGAMRRILLTTLNGTRTLIYETLAILRQRKKKKRKKEKKSPWVSLEEPLRILYCNISRRRMDDDLCGCGSNCSHLATVTTKTFNDDK